LVPSVKSATQIIKYLSSSRHKSESLTQISFDLGLNRSTAYRILTTLELDNMVEYDSSERTYRLGTEIVVLGARALKVNNYLERSEQLIREIAGFSGNTTVLVQRISFAKIAYVLKAEPDTPLHVSATIGQVLPITAGSHGKVFMAFMGKEERMEIYKQIGYPRYTAYTLTKEQFEAEVSSIREAGVALSWEEHVAGVGGVAVPVFRGENSLFGTISCFGLSAELDQSRLRDIAAKVRQRVQSEFL
jgi:DNA-binding IclR family transcriptional regulator